MKFISLDEAVDIGYLQNWYIDSIANERDPVWTDKHLEEVSNDFILIPKEALDIGVVMELNIDSAKLGQPKSKKYELTFLLGIPEHDAESFAELAIKELNLNRESVTEVRVSEDYKVQALVADVIYKKEDGSEAICTYTGQFGSYF